MNVLAEPEPKITIKERRKTYDFNYPAQIIQHQNIYAIHETLK